MAKGKKRYTDEQIAMTMFENKTKPKYQQLVSLYSFAYIKNHYDELVTDAVKTIFNQMVEESKSKLIENSADELKQIDQELKAICHNANIKDADRLKAYDMRIKMKGGYLEKLDINANVSLADILNERLANDDEC